MNNYYRGPVPHPDSRFFFLGAPLLGGFVGGLIGGGLGAAFFSRPRPYYPPYPPPAPYYPYGGYGGFGGPVPYGPGFGGPYGY